MVFNGLEKSELVIFNALIALPRKTFYLAELECLTGYSQLTISNVLRNLQQKEYITFYKNGRLSPYHFEIKDKASVVLNA